MLFLHGGGERGDNNVGQIVANMGATVWASPEFQAEHPSFVLAPQCPLPADVNAFANPDIRDTVRELVLSLMAKYPSIRIACTSRACPWARRARSPN